MKSTSCSPQLREKKPTDPWSILGEWIISVHACSFVALPVPSAAISTMLPSMINTGVVPSITLGQYTGFELMYGQEPIDIEYRCPHYNGTG